jgi:hypothetical protein
MTFDQLMRDLGVEVRRHGEHHHTTSGWVNIDCPFCSPKERRFRLGYNPRGGYCSCWTCGPKNVHAVVMELTGKPYGQVRLVVGDLERTVVKDDIRPEGKLVEPKGVGRLLTPHREYLRHRGFDPESVERLWDVRGTGMFCDLPWRLYIPVKYQDETVSWTTRACSDSAKTRYLSAAPDQEKVPLKSMLYGEDYVVNAVVVVEGPLDVWRIGPGAVATCGTAFSKAQVLRLSRFPVRAVCFDSDRAAQARAKKLADQLDVFDGKTCVVRLQTGKDAAEASSKEIAKLRRRFLD